MQYDALVAQLRTLKLTGMADALEQQLEQPATHDDLSFLERLSLLTDLDLSDTEVSGGDVFTIESSDGEDLVNLTLHADDTLRLDVLANNVTHTLSTIPLSNSWLSISAVLIDGNLSLYADDQLQDNVDVAGIDFPGKDPNTDQWPELKVNIGKGLRAQLDNFELYNPSADPLLEFDGGNTTITLSHDTENPVQNLVVRSMGKLNAGIDSFLAQRSIMVIRDSGTAAYVNLLSTDSYTGLASVYATTLYAFENPGDVPPIDVASLDNGINGSFGKARAVAAVGNFFIKPANAGWFSLDSFVDGLTAVVSLALPINEIKIIFAQMGYLISDPSKFEPAELLINMLSLVTYFPVLRPLQVVVRPMKSFVKKYGDKPAIRALAGVFGDAFESLYKTRSTDKIFSMVPFILVTYELLQEPAAVALMIDGIESTDDLWVWIEYFNMPADGWEGEGEPPRVAVGGDDDTEASAGSMLDWIIPTANAASPFRKKRINGTALGKSIREAFENNGADVNPKDVTGAIKSFSRSLKSSQFIYLRKLVFNPVALQAIIRTFKTGRKNLQNFISGKSSARIPAPMVFAIMAYLQTEMAEGGKLDDPAIQTEIYNLYGDMFADVVFGKGLKEENGGVVVTKDGIEFVDAQATSLTGSAHGAMFHVAMIAYYTLLDELKAVEAERLVFSYSSKADLDRGDILESKRAYFRVVDIVLNDSTGAERWVELKSWQRHDVNKPFGVLSQDLMTMGGKPVRRSGGTTNYTKDTGNRQFHVDRMAGHLGTAFPEFFFRKDWRTEISGNPERFVDVNENFKWWFQQFDVKSRTINKVTIKAAKHPDLGPKTNLSQPGNSGKVRERLTELSFHGTRGIKKDRMEFSLGIKNRTNDPSRTEMANRIDIAKVVQLILDQLKNKNLMDAALDEILLNEFPDLL